MRHPRKSISCLVAQFELIKDVEIISSEFLKPPLKLRLDLLVVLSEISELVDSITVKIFIKINIQMNEQASYSF